jgi:disulfide bond formation protein DsbB
MTGRSNSERIRRLISLLIAAVSILMVTPAGAHHQASNDGPIRGVAILAISHGEMPIIAKYQSQVLDLAARQPVTDPTLRRLAGFVSLQTFSCFWGLVPGSLSDEQSPFNECSHAYLAGVRELLVHMTVMPGNQSTAKALEARMDAELAANPDRNVVCSHSGQIFDSADVIGPDWQLAPLHMPTVLTFLAFVVLVVAGFAVIGRRRLFRKADISSAAS